MATLRTRVTANVTAVTTVTTTTTTTTTTNVTRTTTSMGGYSPRATPRATPTPVLPGFVVAPHPRVNQNDPVNVGTTRLQPPLTSLAPSATLLLPGHHPRLPRPPSWKRSS